MEASSSESSAAGAQNGQKRRRGGGQHSRGRGEGRGGRGTTGGGRGRGGGGGRGGRNRRRRRRRGGRGRGRGGQQGFHRGGDDGDVMGGVNNRHQNHQTSSFSSARNTKSRRNYTYKPRKPPPVSDDASNVTKNISTELAERRYGCMICVANIHEKASVWSCTKCWALFHMKCMRKWVKTLGQESWRCPGCQYIYVEPLGPYKCFCGKVQDPEFDPFITAHSCGQSCNKIRSNSSCPHPCNHQCHPGPCPPCKHPGIQKYCPCGQSTYKSKCGEEKEERTCEKICSKTLSCGNHQCPKKCHLGACEPCAQTEMQTCFCKKQTSERPCGSGVSISLYGRPSGDDKIKQYSCQQICNNDLDCGNHKCQEICHQAACEPCKRAPGYPQKCACGKTDFTRFKYRKTCLDPLPTCDEICGKELSCKIHQCQQKCHDDSCGRCEAKTKVVCHCGTESKLMACFELQELQAESKETEIFINDGEFRLTCRTPCKVSLSCSRHRCARICCPAKNTSDSPFHICERICGQLLRCKKHTCPNFCHLGFCAPCAHVHRNGLSCVCGAEKIPGFVPCGTSLPECMKPCSRPRACGHPCSYNCHPDPCVPCAVFVQKECVGGHATVMSNVQCSAQNVSCGKICGKLLSCGLHFCQRKCHAGACQKHKLDDNKQVVSCGAPCGQKKPHCARGHLCRKPCHPTRRCPSKDCLDPVEVTCRCEVMKKDLPCIEVYDLKMLPCSEECEIQARKDLLREVFLGSNEHAEEARYHELTDSSIEYSKLLIERAQRRENFVKKYEGLFAEFISSESKRTYYLPSMPEREDRWILHQLSAHYELLCEALDSNQNRSLRLMKGPRSKVPTFTLSQVIEYYRETDMARTYTQYPAGCLLQFPDVKESTKEENLRYQLAQFDGHYEIIWMNSSNAFAVFKTPKIMSRAFDQVLKEGRYKVHPSGISDEIRAARLLLAPQPYVDDNDSKTTHISTSSEPQRQSMADMLKQQQQQQQQQRPSASSSVMSLRHVEPSISSSSASAGSSTRFQNLIPLSSASTRITSSQTAPSWDASTLQKRGSASSSAAVAQPKFIVPQRRGPKTTPAPRGDAWGDDSPVSAAGTHLPSATAKSKGSQKDQFGKLKQKRKGKKKAPSISNPFSALNDEEDNNDEW